MKRYLFQVAASAVLALAVSACSGPDASTVPPPSTLTAEAVGHNCQMYILDHDGPKAQIHLKGADAPIWFAEIVDAVSYLRGGEHPAEVTAVYVSDMGRARSWSDPGKDNWVAADKAFYVLGSSQPGGMGTPEAIPFADRNAATDFTQREGGRVVSLGDIPDAYLKQEPDRGAMNMPAGHGMANGG